MLSATKGPDVLGIFCLSEFDAAKFLWNTDNIIIFQKGMVQINNTMPSLTNIQDSLPHLFMRFFVFLFAIVLLSGCTHKAVQEQKENVQKSINENMGSEPEIFYYTVDDSLPHNFVYKIFRVSPILEELDLNTHTFSIVADYYPEVVTNSWKENTILFISNSRDKAIIYSLDVSLQNSQPQLLLTVTLDKSKSEKVDDARFIDDGSAFAFITSGGDGDAAENSLLNIISLQNPSKKGSYLLSEKSPLFASLNFLASTPNSKIIYFHETGGDAGAIWSQWYRLDRIAGTVQKLENLPPIAKGEENPTDAFAFSRDGLRLAYVDFSATIGESYLDFENYSVNSDTVPCLNWNGFEKYEFEGGTIMVQDLKTGKTTEVFRNLSYSDNYCKNVGRRIISLKWLDNDSRLAFETVDGVYTLDINTKQTEPLFSFETTYLVLNQFDRPPILSIQLPFIVFSSFATNDVSIAHTNTNRRIELISPEAQKGHFFTFR